MTMFRSFRWTLLGGVALALCLTVFIDLAILVVPIYDMQLYDRVLMSRNMDTLAVLSVACAIGVLFYGLFEYLRSACFVAISEAVSTRLSGPALAEGVRRAAAGDQRAGPELIGNINHLQKFLASGAVAVPLDAICAPLFVAVLFALHPAFGWLALAGISALVVVGTLSEWISAPGLKSAHEQRQATDYRLLRSLADKDLIDGAGVLPGIVGRWCSRHSVAVVLLSRAATAAQIIAGLSRLIRLALQAGVMALGAVLIIRGQTTPGSLMGANLMLNKCLGPFDHLVESWRSWILARQAWTGVSSLMVAEAPNTWVNLATHDEQPGLTLENLELRLLGGQALLSGVSTHIPPGRLVVLAGPNGSGKTTLLRILAGVITPTGGSVSLNGAQLTSGGRIGYLPQAVCLMDGTVAQNIGQLDPELSRVFETAREAGVHEIVGRMARGYDTHIIGDAVNLSGGLRQRIGLARALYGDPDLLLLDEPDANLDGDGVAALLRVLRARCDAGAIAIVISHRRSLLRQADIVLTLQGGRLAPLAARDATNARQLETA